MNRKKRPETGKKATPSRVTEGLLQAPKSSELKKIEKERERDKVTLYLHTGNFKKFKVFCAARDKSPSLVIDAWIEELLREAK